MNPPRTLGECDKELRDYRKAMQLVSRAGSVAVWEQIDRILEIRFVIQEADRRLAKNARQSQR